MQGQIVAVTVLQQVIEQHCTALFGMYLESVATAVVSFGERCLCVVDEDNLVDEVRSTR